MHTKGNIGQGNFIPIEVFRLFKDRTGKPTHPKVLFSENGVRQLLAPFGHDRLHRQKIGLAIGQLTELLIHLGEGKVPTELQGVFGHGLGHRHAHHTVVQLLQDCLILVRHLESHVLRDRLWFERLVSNIHKNRVPIHRLLFFRIFRIVSNHRHRDIDHPFVRVCRREAFV